MWVLAYPDDWLIRSDEDNEKDGSNPAPQLVKRTQNWMDNPPKINQPNLNASTLQI